MERRALAALVLGLLSASPACNILFGQSDLEAVEGGGTATGADACVPLQCPSTACLDPVCEDNECGTTAVPAGAPCTQSGGKVCNGVGACVECVTDADCETGVCDGQACLPVACTNREKDGTETDIDCGGIGCDPCSPGKMCAVGPDCLSGVCTGQQCQTPSCDDGVDNGSETDVDCGGSGCPGCVGGQACLTNEDCQSMLCDVDTCVVPTCLDGVLNGGESDVDCGGPCAGCADGLTCVKAADCASEICTASTCVLLNHCAPATAVDLTGSQTVNVGFTSQEYNPPCFKIKAGTEVTFQGYFTDRELWGGEILDDITEVPDPASPFMPPTTSGTSKTFTTLTTPGNYGFYCKQKWDKAMMGAVFVVP